MTLELVIVIVIAVLSVLLTVFGESLRRNIKTQDEKINNNHLQAMAEIQKLDERLTCVDKDIRIIRGNYLDKFMESKDHTSNKIAEVLEKINDNMVTNIREHGTILNAITELKTLVWNEE